MVASISLSDYDHHRQEYKNLRLGSLNHQPSGVKGNEYDLDLFSRYLHDNNFTEITGDNILGFIAWLHETRGNKACSINRKEASIKCYFNFLRFKQVSGAYAFPIENLPRSREPYSGPVKALEPDEVIRILAAIDRGSVLGLRDHLLYTMLYRLGLRVRESVNIDISDIDFETEVIHIHGKGRRKRTLPLLPDLLGLIKNWLLYRTRLHGAKRIDALFISKKGNRLSVRTAQDNLKKIVSGAEKFSIDKVTPHSMRHAFATHAIEGEQDIIVLKALLGHSSTKSTEIYVHPSMRILRKAVNDHIASEILDDLIGNDAFVQRVHQSSKVVKRKVS